MLKISEHRQAFENAFDACIAPAIQARRECGHFITESTFFLEWANQLNIILLGASGDIEFRSSYMLERYRYASFETDEDATMFLLRWS